jgi:hypothetical protein
MPGLEAMTSPESNQSTGRPAKSDGQLMFGFGDPDLRQSLPEPNRSQCISLLGSMMLGAIKAKHELPKKFDP